MSQTEELKQANILIAELQAEIGELEGVLINYRRQSADVSAPVFTTDSLPAPAGDTLPGRFNRPTNSGAGSPPPVPSGRYGISQEYAILDDSDSPATTVPAASSHTSEGFLRETPMAVPADWGAYRSYQAAGGDYEINRWLREVRYRRPAAPSPVPSPLEGDGTDPDVWRDGGEVDLAEREVSTSGMYNRAAVEMHRRHVAITGSNISLSNYVSAQRAIAGNLAWGSAIG